MILIQIYDTERLLDSRDGVGEFPGNHSEDLWKDGVTSFVCWRCKEAGISMDMCGGGGRGEKDNVKEKYR